MQLNSRFLGDESRVDSSSLVVAPYELILEEPAKYFQLDWVTLIGLPGRLLSNGEVLPVHFNTNSLVQPVYSSISSGELPAWAIGMTWLLLITPLIAFAVKLLDIAWPRAGGHKWTSLKGRCIVQGCITLPLNIFLRHPAPVFCSPVCWTNLIWVITSGTRAGTRTTENCAHSGRPTSRHQHHPEAPQP